MASSSSSLAVASPQKEIEDELKDCGIKLIKPPHSTEELLNLLDKVESLLIKIGQAPSDSMRDALRPVMTAMIGGEILKNADMDVQVSVASCISELSRITAPQQPYDDELMKEIFQLIIRAFGELSHSGRRCYKAVDLIKTVADVKVCVMLLDLECDALVIEIFQLFLRIIRPDHPNVVCTSMEAIMTQLIEESDEISMELLQPLLDSVKKENQIGSPSSSKLGEKVLKECASIVKPSLVEVLKSTRMNLDDYGEIVASICNEMSGGEPMMENGNAADATQMEDGTPLNNNGTSSKELKHRSRMGKLKNSSSSFSSKKKNTSNSKGSHGCHSQAKKKEKGNKDAQLGLLVPEGDVLQSKDKSNGPLHSVFNLGNKGKGTASSKRKQCRSSRKNKSVSKADVDTTSGLKIVKGGGNLADTEEPSVQLVDEKKQKNDRATIGIHDIEESENKKIKLSNRDENLSSKLAKTKRRRKLPMGKNEDSKRCHLTKNHGEEMVGARIRVWWPLDKVFYEGVVSIFDPVEKKHKILYDDGEEEILNLSEETWEQVEENQSAKKLEMDRESNAVSSVPSTKKKAKRSSSAKKEPGVSSSKKSKRNAQKSEVESLDIPIPDKMNDAADVGFQMRNGKKDLESNAVSSVPSTKKKAKRSSSAKKEPGVSSSKKSKRNAQKSEVESLDIPIPDKMNDAADVGFQMSNGKKDLVDNIDNMITQKQRSKTSEASTQVHSQKVSSGALDSSVAEESKV